MALLVKPTRQSHAAGSLSPARFSQPATSRVFHLNGFPIGNVGFLKSKISGGRERLTEPRIAGFPSGCWKTWMNIFYFFDLKIMYQFAEIIAR